MMTSSAELPLTRDVRQRELVPPQALATCHALVIGVGAIGRQVALQLAAVGMPRMTLFDHDTVGVENLAVQGYWPADVGQPKVDATAGLCQMFPEGVVDRRVERFGRSSARRLTQRDDLAQQIVVFACVDSITARQLIFEALRNDIALFVDGRMSAEAIRVLAVDRPAADEYYATTWFAQSAAYSSGCTARSTIYTASIAAGVMLGQFTRWLRRMSVDRDLQLNLLSSELTAV